MVGTTQASNAQELTRRNMDSFKNCELGRILKVEALNICGLEPAELKTALKESQLRNLNVVSFLEKLSNEHLKARKQELLNVTADIDKLSQIQASMKQLVQIKHSKIAKIGDQKLQEKERAANLEKKQGEIQKAIKDIQNANEEVLRKFRVAMSVKNEAHAMMNPVLLKKTRKQINKKKRDAILWDVIHSFVSIIQNGRDASLQKMNDLLEDEEELLLAMETVKYSDVTDDEILQEYAVKILSHETAFQDKKYKKYTPYYICGLKICEAVEFGAQLECNTEKIEEKEEEKKRVLDNLNRVKPPKHFTNLEHEIKEEIEALETDLKMLEGDKQDLELRAHDLIKEIDYHEIDFYRDLAISATPECLCKEVNIAEQDDHHSQSLNMTGCTANQASCLIEVVSKNTGKSNLNGKTQASTKRGIKDVEISVNEFEDEDQQVANPEERLGTTGKNREKIIVQIDNKGAKSYGFCGLFSSYC